MAKVWNQEFITRWWFYREYFWHAVKSFIPLGLNHYIRLQWKNEALKIMPEEGSVPVGHKYVFRIWGAQKNMQVQGVPGKFLKCTRTARLPPISILIPAFLLLLVWSSCVFPPPQFWPSFHHFPLLLFTLYTYWNSFNTQCFAGIYLQVKATPYNATVGTRWKYRYSSSHSDLGA